MKKLLLLCFAIAVASCESSTTTEPQPAIVNRTPGVGSTFVLNSHQGADSLFTITVQAILPTFEGRDKVIQMGTNSNEPVFFDYESNGDVAISTAGGNIAGWTKLPIASKKEVVGAEERTDNSSGYHTTQHTATPKGVATLTIKGASYTAHVTRLSSTRKYYDDQGILQQTRTWYEEFYWIPELGFFGRDVYVDDGDFLQYDLVDYTLK